MTTPDKLPDNIILCGFMGTGKTTVGQILASRLGWQFADTDQMIEQRAGKTVSAIFEHNGEAAFRTMESAVAADLLHFHNTVIATGGGMVLRPENCHYLEQAGFVVCLDAPITEIAQRLATMQDRPLLGQADLLTRITELMAARAPAYAQIQQHVDSAGQSPLEVAEAILALYHKTTALSPSQQSERKSG